MNDAPSPLMFKHYIIYKLFGPLFKFLTEHNIHPGLLGVIFCFLAVIPTVFSIIKRKKLDHRNYAVIIIFLFVLYIYLSVQFNWW